MPVPIIAAAFATLIGPSISAFFTWLLRTFIIASAVFGVLMVLQNFYEDIIEILAKMAFPVINWIVSLLGYNIPNMDEKLMGIVDCYKLANCWMPLDFGLSLFIMYLAILCKIRGFKLLYNIIPK